MANEIYVNVGETLDEFIHRVMALWDRRLDTRQIAHTLQRPESEVVRALRIGRERRKAA